MHGDQQRLRRVATARHADDDAARVLGQRAQAPRERRRLDRGRSRGSGGRAAPDRTGRREADRPGGAACARVAGGARLRHRASAVDGPERARRARAAFCPNDVCRMRSSASAARSTSAIADAPREREARRSRRAARRGRRSARGRPMRGRRVDSPKPAALYSCTARFFADEMRTRSWRYSHLPTVTFDAERLASTVAPASAASALGGTGTQRSSQISVCSDEAGAGAGASDQDVGAERDVVTEQRDRVAARRRRRLEPAQLVELAIVRAGTPSARRRPARPP